MELEKVYSPKKQLEISDILQAANPSHFERLWMVGFLRYVGHSFDEVVEIIDQHCEWSDYSPRITAYQVRSVFDKQHCKNQHRSTRNYRKRKWDLSPLEVHKIKHARAKEVSRRLDAWLRGHSLPVYDTLENCKAE